MKYTALKEATALEKCELSKYIFEALEESLAACPAEYADSYKTITLDEYSDCLITEQFDEHDCSLGDGIEVFDKSFLLTDEDDYKALNELFLFERDRNWETYEGEKIAEGEEDCVELAEKPAGECVAYDCYGEHSDCGAFEHEYAFSAALANGGNIRQFAKYYGYAIYDNTECECLECYKV